MLLCNGNYYERLNVFFYSEKVFNKLYLNYTSRSKYNQKINQLPLLTFFYRNLKMSTIINARNKLESDKNLEINWNKQK